MNKEEKHKLFQNQAAEQSQQLCHAELGSASKSVKTLKRVQGDKVAEPRQYVSHQELSVMAKEVAEAGQHGSKHELSAVAKVEPEARLHGSKQAAFTLAEVLITLGIIGIVAAMTIPTLVTNYQKRVVEIKLKKFYSTMNQALRMSQVDNGDIGGWLQNSETGSHFFSYDESVAWLSQYLLPYIKYSKIYNANSDLASFGHTYGAGWVGIEQIDGSTSYFRVLGGADWLYCMHKYKTNDDKTFKRDCFLFQFATKGATESNYLSTGLMEPYHINGGSTLNGVKGNANYGCNINNKSSFFCARYIQMNNWKIPDDYPW